MAGIETKKFQEMVDAIGADTIAAIATAGPEMQVGLCGMCVLLVAYCIHPIHLSYL